MKYGKILAPVLMGSTLLIGCSNDKNNDTNNGNNSTPPTTEQSQNPGNSTGTEKPDIITSPSKVTDDVTLVEALNETGPWIVIPQNDIKTDKDIVVSKLTTIPEGKVGRNISLYATDENQNVVKEFTLTAPRLTIAADDVELKRGTFVGDIYVQGKNFKISNTKVQGNIYFQNQEAKDTFKLDGDASVSGVQELKK